MNFKGVFAWSSLDIKVDSCSEIIITNLNKEFEGNEFGYYVHHGFLHHSEGDISNSSIEGDAEVHGAVEEGSYGVFKLVAVVKDISHHESCIPDRTNSEEVQDQTAEKH